MANKYYATVKRVSYMEFEFEAESLESAEEIALKKAYNENWSGEDGNYSVEELGVYDFED